MRVSRRADRADRRGEAGVALVEVVLAFPALLFATGVVVQAALTFHAHNVSIAAAQECASAARRWDADASAGRHAGESYLNSLGSSLISYSSVQVTQGDSVTCAVRGQVVSLVPGFHPSLIEVATGPRERYAPPPVGVGGQS